MSGQRYLLSLAQFDKTILKELNKMAINYAALQMIQEETERQVAAEIRGESTTKSNSSDSVAIHAIGDSLAKRK